jgi:hypothetical protein
MQHPKEKEKKKNKARSRIGGKPCQLEVNLRLARSTVRRWRGSGRICFQSSIVGRDKKISKADQGKKGDPELPRASQLHKRSSASSHPFHDACYFDPCQSVRVGCPTISSCRRGRECSGPGTAAWENSVGAGSGFDKR